MTKKLHPRLADQARDLRKRSAALRARCEDLELRALEDRRIVSLRRQGTPCRNHVEWPR